MPSGICENSPRFAQRVGISFVPGSGFIPHATLGCSRLDCRWCNPKNRRKRKFSAYFRVLPDFPLISAKQNIFFLHHDEPKYDCVQAAIAQRISDIESRRRI
jgi:hypothetical protein